MRAELTARGAGLAISVDWRWFRQLQSPVAENRSPFKSSSRRICETTSAKTFTSIGLYGWFANPAVAICTFPAARHSSAARNSSPCLCGGWAIGGQQHTRLCFFGDEPGSGRSIPGHRSQHLAATPQPPRTRFAGPRSLQSQLSQLSSLAEEFRYRRPVCPYGGGSQNRSRVFRIARFKGGQGRAQQLLCSGARHCRQCRKCFSCSTQQVPSWQQDSMGECQ
jgi:hypothetical protein